LGSPNRSAAEESIEDNDAVPGKLIGLNSNDDDADDIPDYADGYNRDGISGNDDDENTAETFVPLVLEIPEEAGLDTPLKLTYSAACPVVGADPANASGSGGHLRLWTAPGNARRNAAPVTAGGHFVPSDTPVTPRQLGVNSSTWTKTLYLEGVQASGGLANQTIALNLPAEGTLTVGNDQVSWTDTVRVTVVKVEIQKAETDVSDLKVVDADNAVASFADEQSAAVEAVVTPGIPAIQALYANLMQWTGGTAAAAPDERTINRGTPGKYPLKVTFGGAEDALDVWIARVQMNWIVPYTGCWTSTKRTQLVLDIDNDDCDALVDLDDPEVEHEDDLIPLVLSVEPRGIGGSVRMETSTQPAEGEPTAARVAVYQDPEERVGHGKPPWEADLLRLLDDSPSPQLPYLYVQGRELSSDSNDQNLKLVYEWGDFATSDTVDATVAPRHGESSATVKLYKAVKDEGGN